MQFNVGTLKDLKMIIAKKLVLGFLLMLFSQLAAADIFDSLYIATDIGRSKFLSACSGVTPAYTKCKDYDFSNRTSLGILVADFTNAELGYFSSGKASKKGAGNTSNEIDSVEWQLSGMRYFPIGDGRLNSFVRMGLVHWEVSEAKTVGHLNTSGNSVLLGVGGKFFITKNIALRAHLETHKIGNSRNSWSGNVLFMGTGLTYQFN